MNTAMSQSPNEKPSALVERLLAQHRIELLAFVRSRGRGRVVAEDVVQQVAVQALNNAERLRDPSSGRAWLFRITRNVLADELRRPRPIEVEIIDDQLADEVDDEGERCACVLTVVQGLKPEYSSLLARVVVEDQPVSDVAKALGITANNAMVRLHRARTALKQRLIDHCGTDSLRACLNCACDENGSCSTV